MAFKLPELGYAFDALEPHIDEKTMKVHHGKHHAGYTKKLNNAIEGTNMEGKDIEDILKNLDMSNSAVRNNGGGYWNHAMFWEIMNPEDRGRASGAFLDAVKDAFGSMDDMKEKFKEAATGQFGSGWAWLCVHKGGKLEICNTPNQDNPLMPGVGCGGYPIMGVDVWEHAYYLNYQNERGTYIDEWFKVVNWNEVERRYDAHK